MFLKNTFRKKPNTLFIYPIYIPFVSIFLFSCTHDADLYPIKGIDISHYQKTIDWEEVRKDSSLHFVFIKATEADDYRDSIFQQNWEALGQSHLKRGAYHFFRPQISAELQANNFISQVTLIPGDLAPVLDIETLDNVSAIEVVDQAAIWLSFIETHYQVKPIIYSSMDFYEKYLKTRLGHYPRWIARYHRFSPETKDWHFWQYSNRGYIKGIDGPVDLNVFSGDTNLLNEFLVPRE